MLRKALIFQWRQLARYLALSFNNVPVAAGTILKYLSSFDRPPVCSFNSATLYGATKQEIMSI